MIKKALLIAVLVASYFDQNVLASSVTATTSGNWNQTATWGGSAVPDGTPCYDTIIIPASITVTINVQVNLSSCPATKVFVYGSLNFTGGNKLTLATGSFVYLGAGGGLQTGGGGGSSNLITIGTTDLWSAGCSGSPPPDCGTMMGIDILCVGCSLPVELIAFTATLNQGIVLLNWETASETENDGFWVQRSQDGLNWENIGWVDGALNSSEHVLYSFEDRNPLLGNGYYRLKQVDMNGAHEYSPIRMVTNGNIFSGQEMLVINESSGYQNSFALYFAEPIDGEVHITITAINGAVIYDQTYSSDSEEWIVITLNRALSTGVYVVKANRQIEKIITQ